MNGQKRIRTVCQRGDAKAESLLQYGKSFIVGGLICVVGQILLHIGKTQFSLSKDDAGSWCSLILILSSVILTGLNIYQKIVTFAGCGALVPSPALQLGCSSCD